MPGGEKSAEQRLTARKTLRRNTGLASAPRLVRRGLWSDKSSALALGALRHTASRRRLRAGVGRNSRKKDQSRHRLEEKSLKS